MWKKTKFDVKNIICDTISAGNDNFIAISIEGKSIYWALLHQCHVMHHGDHNSPRFSLGSLNKHKRIFKLKEMIKLGTKFDRTKGIEFKGNDSHQNINKDNNRKSSADSHSCNILFYPKPSNEIALARFRLATCKVAIPIHEEKQNEKKCVEKSTKIE